MKLRVISFVSIISVCTLSIVAQNKSAAEQYYEFRRKAMREYDDFRNNTCPLQFHVQSPLLRFCTVVAVCGYGVLLL